MSQRKQHATRLLPILTWATLVLFGIISVLPLVPPAPQSPFRHGDFSVELALSHIEQLAQEPRPMGSPGNARGREKITHELRQLGLEPQFQSLSVPNYYSREGEPVDVVNIMARIPGTDPTGAVLLTGHHDTVPATLGANDDASAIAILLDIARVLLADEPLRNDIILLFTDGEEPAPRYGSTAFASEHPWMKDVRFVINLETIGSTGVSLVVDMSGSTRWLGRVYAQSVPYPTAFSFVTALTELIGGSNTDFATFRDAGIPGVDTAYMIGSPIYHTMADAPDTVSRRSLYQHGANALGLAQDVGNLDLNTDHGDSDGIFFSIARYVSIHYPSSWSVPILIIAGLIVIAAALRQGLFGRTLIQSLLTVGVIVGPAIVAALIWMILGRLRASMGMIESYIYLAGLVTLGALFGSLSTRLFRRHVEPLQDALGVLSVWWVIGLATARIAPGASYLFVWPSLIGSLMLLLQPVLRRRPIFRIATWSILSGTTLVLLVPAIDFFYQLAQPRPGNPDSEILPTIVIPMILAVLVLELVRAFRRGLHSSQAQQPN